MIYLSQQTTEFLRLAFMAALENERKVYTFGTHENILFLKIKRNDKTGIYFSLNAGDFFSISIYQYGNKFLPYSLKDIEYIGENEIISVSQKDLTNPQRHIKAIHFVIRSFVETIVHSLINYTQTPTDYKGELSDSSFITIRILYALFAAEVQKFIRFNVTNTVLGVHSVTLTVYGKRFKGHTEIRYNIEKNIYEIWFCDLNTNVRIGGRNHVQIVDIIPQLEKQISFVSEYENK